MTQLQTFRVHYTINTQDGVARRHSDIDAATPGEAEAAVMRHYKPRLPTIGKVKRLKHSSAAASFEATE